MIDSHIHLEMEEFNKDRAEVIKRAEHAGVEAMITVGTTVEDCYKAVEIANSFKCVYAAVGIHPHETKEINDNTYESLRKLCKNKKVVAFGEIGLDFFRDLSPRHIQTWRFREQLELASELDLPVIIHDREAHSQVLEILRKWNGKRGGVIHCFSGNLRMAEEFINLGFYISIAGPVTYAKKEKLREVVRSVPLERILIETDAPYLPPQPFRGKRNEPAYIGHTARKIAEIKEVPLEEVDRITSINARLLFCLPPHN
ncbi:MAG: TatD family hydrolase [Syntrophales bacterium]|nr:TatD family hydrolase [Syntrophales bacterium]